MDSALNCGESDNLLLGVISSVLAGAVFGDHCSPISDTTILSSMSSACDHIDHVRTQLPYALLAALVGIVVGDSAYCLRILTLAVPGPWDSSDVGVLLLLGRRSRRPCGNFDHRSVDGDNLGVGTPHSNPQVKRIAEAIQEESPGFALQKSLARGFLP